MVQTELIISTLFPAGNNSNGENNAVPFFRLYLLQQMCVWSIFIITLIILLILGRQWLSHLFVIFSTVLLIIPLTLIMMLEMIFHIENRFLLRCIIWFPPLPIFIIFFGQTQLVTLVGVNYSVKFNR